MNLKEKAYKILQIKLKLHPELFLIDFDVDSDNNINIVLDGDSGITVSDLIDFSRTIEQNLDRENNDFSLTISSFDISSPLQHIRQYHKNLNRNLKVKTNKGKIEGKLVEITDTNIVLEYKKRVPKEVGKGKKTIIIKDKIPFNEIIESKVVIKFKK